MHKQILVNLAVSDPKRSITSFRSLGFDVTRSPPTTRAPAVAAHREPQDHGFMYGHGFEEPDGHVWDLVHMSGDPPSA